MSRKQFKLSNICHLIVLQLCIDLSAFSSIFKMVTRYLILVLLSAMIVAVLGAPEIGASNAAVSTYQSEPDSYYRRGRQTGYPYSNSYFGGGYQPSYNNYNQGGGYGGYSSSFGYPYNNYQQQSWTPSSYYRYNQNYNYPRYNNYQSGYNYNPGFGGGYSSSYGVVPIPNRQYGGYAKK